VTRLGEFLPNGRKFFIALVHKKIANIYENIGWKKLPQIEIITFIHPWEDSQEVKSGCPSDKEVM
jgi:hypothetical protein